MKTYDTIQIMRDGFQSPQVDQIVEGLEADGHRYDLFQGFSEIGSVLANSRTGLLLAASATTDTTNLIDGIKLNGGDGDVPLLVYFNQICQVCVEDIVRPEIDDFMLAPFNVADLRLRVNRLFGRLKHRRGDVDAAGQNLLSQFAAEGFIGSAPCFLASIKRIPDIASCDATVLLIGATGTGKELSARAIHYLSSRADKPFVPLNCGSVPAKLFENELFGHESGAYTDARRSHRGLIREAEGGTLFLDEVDSFPLSSQIKLLRFLQDRQYRPLGGFYRRADIFASVPLVVQKPCARAVVRLLVRHREGPATLTTLPRKQTDGANASSMENRWSSSHAITPMIEIPQYSINSQRVPVDYFSTKILGFIWNFHTESK